MDFNARAARYHLDCTIIIKRCSQVALSRYIGVIRPSSLGVDREMQHSSAEGKQL